ncbi:M14 family metallopeptidase [Thalassotalea sp. PS06]|uniref:M14 family metallopeptidase n=1 Tax=Thalassotalea sp. PS06 TaxID=2594005 RepID=UPI001164689F|nr:M14 family metallopeptidase [Thalassotalea sp. PS06]QDP00593.1 peptidase [Thalassotalea sp. PS06]
MKLFLKGLLVLSLASLSPLASASVLMKPNPVPGAEYPALLQGNYVSDITTPESFLGFDVGQKTATPEQINQLVRLWASESDKVKLVEYAKSYEGRSLHYLVISSKENINNLDSIKENIQALSAPDSLTANQQKQLLKDTPATAWMAYSIHGNESSGADSALALIYHLIASKDDETQAMLGQLLVIVDPMMNPDGRARFTKQLEQNRSTAPNFDVQSLLHSGVWPFGRTNHYHFDLNRDFYYAVNPESRGRIKAINQWNPLLMIDGHEMGALDNFLFGPPREPINEHIADSINRWSKVFSEDQAAAFDKQNWPYYTGEWFENLYPGYSNYAEYRGAIHILYEQARTAEDGVKLRNGTIRSYKQSVHHQYYSALANLKTLQDNREAIFADYVENRKSHIAKDGKYADQSFVVLANNNHSRTQEFLDLMDLQGIKYYRNEQTLNVRDVTNQLGEVSKRKTIPKNSIIIPNRQYNAPLIAAILEFDANIKDSVLLEERQKTLRDGSSVMYDATAWNLTMMYGLEAWQVGQHLSGGLGEHQIKSGQFSDRDNAIAYLIDGDDDASVSAAARLLEQNLNVRVLDKPGLYNDIKFARGTVAISVADNQHKSGWLETLKRIANETQVNVQAISQGLGDEDLPDIGSEHFQLLRKPQIALLTQNGISPYDYGHIWHLIDTQLGVRHSHLAQELIARSDLRAYNVLVIPGRWYGQLSKATLANINTWVSAGGTLIVSGNSVGQFAKAEDFIQTKLLSDSFEDIQEYNLALTRQWLSEQANINNAKQLGQHKVSDSVWYPWQNTKDLKPMDKKQLSQWDKWTQAFMPSGALLATRTDQKHWLTYGVDRVLPVLTDDAPLLMTKSVTSAVARYGVYTDNKEAKERMIGWSTIPEGKDVSLRMSGLLWPEAAQRIANAAYLTQERKGNGQVILFANSPNFRGATKGTARLLLNAMVYGPGLGSRAPIQL